MENIMSQIDPWEKAADCERALMLSQDPIYRGKAIGRLHANLSATTQMH